ncbi:MAG: hypothetical protein ACAI44_11425 [Candidatus Sericytochromatia bacterium]
MAPISGCDSPKLQRLTVADSLKQMQACQPAAVDSIPAEAKPTELHPWLKNTFIGTAVGTLAGSGTALTVSHFLDDPLMALHHTKLGGIQGAVSGTAGAIVAYWAPDRASGTVMGALAGAGVAVAQALGTGASKAQLIGSALTGLAAGAAAGNVSVLLRDRNQQAHKAIEEASLAK